MNPLTIQQFCELTRSRISGSIDSASVIQGAVIDSRDVIAGNLFFALPGSTTHGIRFAAEALKRGAIVVTDPTAASGAECPLIVAPSPRHALQRLAQFHRAQSEALVIGITGSVGKTTTRRLLTSILSATLSGTESPANYNNGLGVPLSLLQINQDTEFAAIEMGAASRGDIKTLCRMVQPEFAIVTRVAPAHLNGFRSMDTIQATKRELVESIDAGGTVFLNADDRYVRQMASATRGRVVLFGQSSDADIRCNVVHSTNSHLVMEFAGEELIVPICGRHHASNVAAAVAVATELGLTTDEIQTGLDQFVPEPGRTVPQTIGGMDVIDDTYNASPASVQAAAEVLSGWQTSGRRIFVLGDMLDLGDQAETLHFAVGVLLAQSSIDHTLALGEWSDAVAAGFRSAGGNSSRISVFENRATLDAMLDCIAVPGDTVLIKGSRGMQMECVLNGLQTVHAGRSVSTPLRRAA